MLQQPVVAHDVVISSNPQDGAKVTEFPTTVELTFSGIPKKGLQYCCIESEI
ncbi:copper resistance protein CopC [Corynebacterium diphtheriae bv. gravis]|nr:copper resistance protein CopC [Corynebacterium diphtheriae bv. gravis]